MYPMRPRTSSTSCAVGKRPPPRKKPHVFIRGPTVMSNAPSDSRAYRSDSAMKSNSSGSTATGPAAASRLRRESGLSGL